MSRLMRWTSAFASFRFGSITARICSHASSHASLTSSVHWSVSTDSSVHISASPSAERCSGCTLRTACLLP
eukprot:1882341-Rhodomonas_salina.2